MNTYELLCKTNWDMIKGKTFTENEKETIANQFLAAVSDEQTVARFHNGVKAAEDQRAMYPLFYIPPYNGGKKLPLINGLTPKTHILSANHYELEILRLLALWRVDKALPMLQKTKKRLAATCFGNYCPTGECYETSIVTLRFLASAFSDETGWIKMLIARIGGEMDRPHSHMRHSKTLNYYWLALTDVLLPEAMDEIRRYEPQMIQVLSKKNSYRTESQQLYTPITQSIVRNCLARLPNRYFLDSESSMTPCSFS